MNHPYHILVVEDEVEMAQLIAAYLRKEGYHVTLARNGEQFLRKLKEDQIDLVVLDVMMEQMDGFTACQKAREFSKVPIIMVTAKGAEEDRIHGLKMGADDYIVKPFSPRELVARIEALLRRANYMTPTSTLDFGHLQIDAEGRTVTVDGEPITLTRKEYDLLLLLARNKDKVLTREMLHEQIWGMDSTRSSLRTVDTHIKTLRLKLGIASPYITTVWGVGYKFEIVPLEKRQD